MKLTLTGHDRSYDLQSIATAFFPDLPFDENAPFVESSLAEQDGVRGCETIVRDNLRVCRAFSPIFQTDKEGIRAAVKAAFFAAAAEFTGFAPPWGTFTGIRPVREFSRLEQAAGSRETAAAQFCDRFSATPSKAQLCAEILTVRDGLFLPVTSADFSLYISIPFCPSRCAYCSFISGAGEKLLSLIPDYLTLLCHEIEALGSLAARQGLTLRSVYIGGGTPAVLSETQLNALAETIKKSFAFSGLMEYTVEAGRPDVITAGKLAAVRDGGAGRICINPQSLNDRALAAIGRAHTAAQFVHAFAQAKQTGFAAVNCDLIAGLPGDDLDTFTETLNQIINLGAENITVHALCLKHGSDLHISDDRTVVRETAAAAMQEQASLMLAAAGYRPYYLYKQKNAVGALENTGWAKPDTECIYNILMMDDLGTVLAAGAGCTSKIITPAGSVRVYSPKYPYEYLRGAAQSAERIGRIETVLAGLRSK